MSGLFYARQAEFDAKACATDNDLASPQDVVGMVAHMASRAASNNAGQMFCIEAEVT
jgi:hypothetical protein